MPSAREGKASPLPRITDLAARVRDGEDLRAIAAQYGVSYQTLLNRFSTAGFSTTSESEQQAKRRALQVSPERRYRSEPWIAHAACRSIGCEAFFVDEKDDYSAPARVCMTRCTVRLQCLDWAMRTERGLGPQSRFGMVGGLRPDERSAYETEWLADGAA